MMPCSTLSRRASSGGISGQPSIQARRHRERSSVVVVDSTWALHSENSPRPGFRNRSVMSKWISKEPLALNARRCQLDIFLDVGTFRDK